MDTCLCKKVEYGTCVLLKEWGKLFMYQGWKGTMDTSAQPPIDLKSQHHVIFNNPAAVTQKSEPDVKATIIASLWPPQPPLAYFFIYEEFQKLML